MIKDVLLVDGIPSAQGAKISNVGNGNFQRRFSNFPTLVFALPFLEFFEAVKRRGGCLRRDLPTDLALAC